MNYCSRLLLNKTINVQGTCSPHSFREPGTDVMVRVTAMLDDNDKTWPYRQSFWILGQQKVDLARASRPGEYCFGHSCNSGFGRETVQCSEIYFEALTIFTVWGTHRRPHVSSRQQRSSCWDVKKAGRKRKKQTFIFSFD